MVSDFLFVAIYAGSILTIVAISAVIVAILTAFKFNIHLVPVILFVNTILLVVFSYRIFYDLFIYEGWFKGLEAVVWGLLAIPVLAVIYLYILVGAVWKKKGSKKVSAES